MLLPPNHIQGKKYITCYDPSNGLHITTVPADAEIDINIKIDAAKRASDEWKTSPFQARKRIIRSLLAWIVRERETIARICCRDTGKTMIDTALGEIMTTCSKIEWLLKHGEKALKPSSRGSNLLLCYKSSKVYYDPLGVVAAIVSWNYPLHNALSPILAGLFAGNSVVVAQAATVNLTPVVLELGGKDPAIILPSTDLEKYASIWMRGVFQASGQNCIGIERFIVPDYLHDEFVELMAARIKKLRLGSVLSASDDGFVSVVDMGSMISDARFGELERLVKAAERDGARIIAGGERWDHAYLEEGSYFGPTLLGHVNENMEIAQTEVFAPIMLVMPYSTVEEAITIANGSRYGLGASVFGPDDRQCMNVARYLECGMVSINDFGVFYLNQDLPFGGVKGSGYGRFAGPEGLRGLCNPKAIVVDRWPWLIQTSIPAALDYPVRSLIQSWDFITGLIDLLYADTWKDKLLGLIRMADIIPDVNGTSRLGTRITDRANATTALSTDPKFKKYTQQVDKCLASFENVHEWADFIAFLTKLLKTLQSFMQFKEIPRKLIVGKRLAQCLNPALPTGVHQRALDVYSHVLAVLGPEGLKRDLQIWSAGLFPFFAYSATSVRPTLLNIYDTHYLALKSGLRPVMKAFILALLPGLEEENGEFFDKVLGILDRLSATVSQAFFLQNVWLVLLTTPSVRCTAVAYLSRRFPKLSDEPDITAIVGRDVGLMVRAFASSLEDDDTLVRRGVLELLNQSFKMDSPAFKKVHREDQEILVRAALGVVLRRDLSLSRRLYTWLLGNDETSDAQIAYLKAHGLDLETLHVHLPLFLTGLMELINALLDREGTQEGHIVAVRDATALMQDILGQLSSGTLNRSVNLDEWDVTTTHTSAFQRAASFYALPAQTDLLSLPATRATLLPFLTTVEDSLSASAKYAHMLVDGTGKPHVELLRGCFSGTLSIIVNLVSQLDSKIGVEMRVEWKPLEWLSSVLSTLDQQATFEIIDKVVSSVLPLSQSRYVRPPLPIDNRETMARMVSVVSRVLDPILHDVMDPSIRRTPAVQVYQGREARGFTYDKPIDLRRLNHILESLLSVKSPITELVSRAEAAKVSHESASYMDVLIEVLLRFIQSEPKQSLVASMLPGNAQLQATALDLLQAIVSQGEVDPLTLDNVEAAIISKLYVSVHAGRLELQNKLLHVLHSVILASSTATEITPAQKARLYRTSDIGTYGEDPVGRDPVSTSPTNPVKVNPLFVQTLVDGISKETNRPILQHWIDFILMTIPQFQQSFSPLIFPLCDCICRELRTALDDVVHIYHDPQATPDVHSSTTDAEFIILLNALERLVLLGLAKLDTPPLDDENVVQEKPTQESSGLLGLVSNVFGAEVSSINEEYLTPRSPGYQCLDEAVRILYSIWIATSLQPTKQGTPILESLQLTYSRVRLRCRKVLERLFRAQSAEVLESLIECWSRYDDFIESSTKAIHTFEVVDMLTTSAQTLIHMLCESISYRYTPASERTRKLAINPNLSDAVIYNFMDEYLGRLEGPIAVQVWNRYLSLAKEVASNVHGYKRQVFPTLKSVSSPFITRDTFVKLADTCVLIAGRSFEQGNWIRRGVKDGPTLGERSTTPLPRVHSEVTLGEKEKVDSPLMQVDDTQKSMWGPDLVDQADQRLPSTQLDS
ncbi:hypothetical protein FRB99_005472 [Tulasnella sp. 403]|nr:hypothetical protein FRB99_005472 [Tulasnella sp. 403]